MIYLVILGFIAIGPVVFLLNYIYKKDTHSEPKSITKKVLTFGCLSVIPTLIMEIILGKYFPVQEGMGTGTIFMNVFVGVAIVEEFFKWCAIMLVVWKNDEFNESYDGIVYAVYSSLGFAVIENIEYVFLGGGLMTGILRAITALPGHTCFAVIMGFFISKAKREKYKGDSLDTFSFLALSLIAPACIHTIYDGWLFAGQEGIWIVSYIAILVMCIAIVKYVAKNNLPFFSSPTPVAVPTSTGVATTLTPVTTTTNLPQQPVAYPTTVANNQTPVNTAAVTCPSCGTVSYSGNFCPTCGTKVR